MSVLLHVEIWSNNISSEVMFFLGNFTLRDIRYMDKWVWIDLNWHCYLYQQDEAKLDMDHLNDIRSFIWSSSYIHIWKWIQMDVILFHSYLRLKYYVGPSWMSINLLLVNLNLLVTSIGQNWYYVLLFYHTINPISEYVKTISTCLRPRAVQRYS